MGDVSPSDPSPHRLERVWKTSRVTRPEHPDRTHARAMPSHYAIPADGKAPGALPLLSAEQRHALLRIVEVGPIPASHGVVRWRLIDLAQWVWDEFGVSISKQTLSRELRESGYRKLSARPRHHTQDADAIPAFKKTSPPSWQRSGRRSLAVRP